MMSINLATIWRPTWRFDGDVGPNDGEKLPGSVTSTSGENDGKRDHGGSLFFQTNTKQLDEYHHKDLYKLEHMWNRTLLNHRWF